MPFSPHPNFPPPEDQNAQLWRYMDITKFLSLLDKSSLFFVRVDKLASIDPFEGYYTRAHLMFEGIDFDKMPDDWKTQTGITTRNIFDIVVRSHRQTREIVKHSREVTFVSSWHVQSHESAAMWKMYLTGHDGVAIQSSYTRMIESLASYADFEVHIGRVQYLDYENETIPAGNLLAPFMYKRKSFAYEHELRALIWTPQHGKNDLTNPANNRFKDDTGLYVAVDLDALIERVYVSPAAGAWVLELVQSICTKYGLVKEVVRSDLASPPLY